MELKNYYHVVENALSKEECELIQTLAERDWEVKKESREGLGFRESQVAWIPNDGDFKWIFDKIMPMADEVRKKNWRTFKLKSLKPLQYTVYHAPFGKYDWHTDTADANAPGDMASRLLSFSVQLTNPTECYKGGDFELIKELKDNFRSARANENFNMDKKVIISPFTQGSIVFFPSIVVHRVTPVTEGTRKSLVGWIEGSFI